MLQTIRERAQGLVAAVIVGLLILTFAVWGIESYLNEARRVVIAEVGGEEIELAAYQETYQRMRQRAQAELGDAFDPAVWAEQDTKLKALDFLVEEELLKQNVDRARLRISDDQVSEYLKTSPNFQVEGKFSRERYAQVTSMLGFSERSFESRVRQDLALQQLRAGVAASSFVTRPESQSAQQVRQQTRTIAYALIAPAEASGEVISDADLAAHYAAYRDRYRIPDKVALEFVELKLADLRTSVTVNDELLTAYYDAHKPDFTVEEQRNASHVLIQVKADATPAEIETAQQEARKIRDLVIKGENFETVAKEHSDDIGSRGEGGETGLFGRGVMAPEFEQAVFSMNVGDISEPIKSDFGFHIIKLNELKPGGTKPYVEVKAEVEAAYRDEQAQEQYFEAAEHFSDAVIEHPDALTESADMLDIAVHATSPLLREEIAAQFSAAVADAVWEPEVLSEGLASAPIEIGNDRVVAVRVKHQEPSRIPALDEIKDNVTAEIQQQRVRQAAAKRGAAIVARLRGGESVAAVMSAEKLDWQEHESAARDDATINRAVLRAAFKAQTPVDATARYLGFELGSGSYAVVAVSNPQAPAIEQLDTQGTQALRRDGERLRAAGEWRDFIEMLRADAKVVTYPEKI